MDLEILDTADQVFDALGGNSGVAEVTAAKAPRVSNWRAAGSFPPNTYVAMTDALRVQGKTAPATLWRMLEAAQ
jgi:hypothetical protein